MLSQSEEPMWVSAMLGHKHLAITLSVYVKYIPRRYIKRASFLDNYQWNAPQSKQETLSLASLFRDNIEGFERNKSERAKAVETNANGYSVAQNASNLNFTHNCLF